MKVTELNDSDRNHLIDLLAEVVNKYVDEGHSQILQNKEYDVDEVEHYQRHNFLAEVVDQFEAYLPDILNEQGITQALKQKLIRSDPFLRAITSEQRRNDIARRRKG